jgi:hypothetical protein
VIPNKGLIPYFPLGTHSRSLAPLEFKAIILNMPSPLSHATSIQLSVGGNPELSAMAGATRHSGLISRSGTPNSAELLPTELCI